MARKRKLDASGTAPTVEADPQPAMGGMWGGTAMNMLKQRLSDTRDSLVQGVLNGTVALSLDPAQIVDEMGSDRLSVWEDEPEFQALVENIRRRGQAQAIRVRPENGDWTPDVDDPLHTDARFVIQSGRRRLAAAAALGRPVLAVISTVEGDQALADLEERFHENTMRKNLSGFEELLSVGLIAEALGDLSQSEIAARLGVSQNDVSLGRSCVEMHAQIVAAVDVAATPKRAYREIIPRLRAGQGAASPKAKRPQPVTVQRGDVGVTLKPSRGGYALTLKTGKDIDPDWLVETLAKLVDEA
jgi:ParB/RepB/Spo0J family partition protein